MHQEFELMAREHHTPKLNSVEVMRNLLRRLKMNYEFFTRKSGLL